jgi:hypothetical protein
MSLRSLSTSDINGRSAGMLLASCLAIVVTNVPARPTSPPPLEKKKLAPSRFWSEYLRATVRAIVDFPVPANPFSQKIGRLSSPPAQSNISWRRSTRVSGRHRESWSRLRALKGASTAYGNRLSGLSDYDFRMRCCNPRLVGLNSLVSPKYIDPRTVPTTV